MFLKLSSAKKLDMRVLNGFEAMCFSILRQRLGRHFGSQTPSFPVPWLQSDGQDFFSHHKQAIQSCDSSTVGALLEYKSAGVLRIQRSGQNHQIYFAVLHTPFFLQNLRKIATPKSEGPKPFNPNTTIVLGKAHKVAGSYRCTSGSRRQT